MFNIWRNCRPQIQQYGNWTWLDTTLQILLHSPGLFKFFSVLLYSALNLIIFFLCLKGRDIFVVYFSLVFREQCMVNICSYTQCSISQAWGQRKWDIWEVASLQRSTLATLTMSLCLKQQRVPLPLSWSLAYICKFCPWRRKLNSYRISELICKKKKRYCQI